MKMLTFSANQQRDITNFINDNGISKEQIVNIYQAQDKTFILNYFDEEK